MPKILIIDDYVDLILVLKIFLGMQGYKVEECSKSEDVFTKIYSFSPDLIILDVFLDGESGRSLCMKIKNMNSTKHIPVILYSGHIFPPEYLENCHHNDFIQKPFELDDIKKKIEIQLRGLSKIQNSGSD